MTRQIFLSCVNPQLSSLLPLLLLSLLFIVNIPLSLQVHPEIVSYARVSSNRDAPIVAANDSNVAYHRSVSQSRSFQDLANTRSPVYVSTKLRNGEAVDHTLAKKYTTLDREAIAQLESLKSRKHAQERFHPPASFEHVIAHNNAMRQKIETLGSQMETDAKKPKFPVPSYATLPQEVYSTSYDYHSEPKPPTNDRPGGETDDYSPDSGDFSKIPDSYAQPEIHESEQDEDPKFSGFPSSSSYANAYPSKPLDIPDHYERPSYADVSYPHNYDYPHGLIYDHPPDHHFHDHTTTTTTEEPEMNDQRLSKRPYSYYYIGKKLWYLPLYFSIYFIIYIAALVLKSIARHKINFPASLAAVAADGRNADEPYDGPGWYDLTKRVLDGIDVYNSIGKSKISHNS